MVAVRTTGWSVNSAVIEPPAVRNDPVRVDVRVLDKKGGTIVNLNRVVFHLFEDGKEIADRPNIRIGQGEENE